jgi:hypothetical protein
MVCAILAKGPNNSSVHSQFGTAKCSKPELKNEISKLSVGTFLRIIFRCSDAEYYKSLTSCGASKR